MGGTGWLIISVIVLFILLAWYYSNTKRREIRSTKPKMPPSAPPVHKKQRHKNSSLSPTDAAYTTSEIMHIVTQGYQTRHTIHMQYETADPQPGQPAVNVRDVDVYGLGKDYFDAFCHLRNDIRVFKIPRVIWAQLTNATYEIPPEYRPSSWVEYGWGNIREKTSENMSAIPKGIRNTNGSGDSADRWVWTRTTEHEANQSPGKQPPTKPQPTPSEILSGFTIIKERAKPPIRHDTYKRFENSILSPFPEELSPALPYLREAHRLESEGADQREIDQVLRKAHEADPQATQLYLQRLSIIKERESKQAHHKPILE